MTEYSSADIAEIADRHRRHFAYIMLGIALIHFSRILEGLLAPESEVYTDALAVIAAVTVVFYGFRIALWKARNLTAELRELYVDKDGFVATAILRAHAISWGFTFVFLVLIATLNDTLATVSGVMLVQVGVVVIAGTFGASVLWLTRDDGADAADA